MTKVLPSLLKVSAGYFATKFAVASNGDKTIFTDENITNMTAGAVAGAYFFPKLKKTLEAKIADVSAGKSSGASEIFKYLAIGGVAIGTVYALEHGAHKRLVDSTKEFYDKHLKPGEE